MKFVFLGAPGAGKGTLAEIVSEKYNIPVISTGNIIRAAIKDGTSLGKKAAAIIESGNLVDDATVIEIIRERLSKDDCKNGFILDGFPRTLPQAKALDSITSIDYTVYVEVSDEVIIDRLAGRRYCKKCGATYHIVTLPSKDGEKCDKCGETLSIRSDDSPETVANRLKVYHEMSEPLIEYYKSKGTLATLDGTKSIEGVRCDFFEIIEGKK